MMRGDGGVGEVAAETPKTRERAILVGAGQPAVSDDIRYQDRRELSGPAHCAPPAVGQIIPNASPRLPVSRKDRLPAAPRDVSLEDFLNALWPAPRQARDKPDARRR